jgi:tyrosinase
MPRLFNRRALLLGGTAAGGALILRDEPFSPVLCGPGSIISTARAQPVTPRVRPSLATPEGNKMLALYGKAIGRMKELPRHDPRNWYFQANIHGYPEGRPVNGRRSAEMQQIINSLPQEERTRWIFSPDRGQTAEEKAQVARNRALALGPPGQHGVWHSCSHFHHHFNPGMEASRENHFLSWHRMYLHFFEQAAASVLDPSDPPFALPYWDYLHRSSGGDLDQLALPAAFASETLAGGRQNHLFFAPRNDDFVSGGLPADVVDTRDLLRLDDLLTGGGSGSGFNADINQLPHGAVHGVIGPTLGMGSFEFAGRDPLFWVHHASVDRLWESWRRPANDGTSGFDPAASDWRNVRFNFAGADARQVPMTVSDAVMLPVTQQTRYDQLIDLGGAMAATSEVRRTGPRTTLAEARQSTAPQITDKNVGVPIQVPAPARDITAGLRNQADARYFLVIDVEAASAPGGLYRVFARGPSVNGTTEHLLGTFNLFGSLADGKRTTTWSADITRQVRQKLIDPDKPLDLIFRAAYAKPAVPVTIKRVRVRAL